MSRPVLKTSLCDLLDVEYPICLAGMGGRWTPPELVAAVSNAGGLGVMGGSGIQVDELRQRIRKVRELTDKPFGVDLLLPVVTGSVERDSSGGQQESEVDAVRRQYPRHAEFVDTLMAEFGLDRVEPPPPPKEIGIALARSQVDMILEEDVQVFAAALGDPGWMVPQAHDKGVVVMGLAGSVRNAQRQIAAGVDIVVAQGTEAGGHTGRIATMPLVPQIVDAISPKPVVAAGGIANGRGIAASLALGADGSLAWNSVPCGEGVRHLPSPAAVDHPWPFRRLPDFKVLHWEDRPPVPGADRAGVGSVRTGAARHAAPGRSHVDLQPGSREGQALRPRVQPGRAGRGHGHEARPAADIMADLVDETVSVLNEMKERVTT